MSKITFQGDIPGLLTYPEAAEILGVSRPNIYNMINTGRLHRLEIGGNVYVLKEEVDELARGQDVTEKLRIVESQIRFIREDLLRRKATEAGVTATPASS